MRGTWGSHGRGQSAGSWAHDGASSWDAPPPRPKSANSVYAHGRLRKSALLMERGSDVKKLGSFGQAVRL